MCAKQVVNVTGKLHVKNHTEKSLRNFFLFSLMLFLTLIFFFLVFIESAVERCSGKNGILNIFKTNSKQFEV